MDDSSFVIDPMPLPNLGNKYWYKQEDVWIEGIYVQKNNYENTMIGSYFANTIDKLLSVPEDIILPSGFKLYRKKGKVYGLESLESSKYVIETNPTIGEKYFYIDPEKKIYMEGIYSVVKQYNQHDGAYTEKFIGKQNVNGYTIYKRKKFRLWGGKTRTKSKRKRTKHNRKLKKRNTRRK